MLTKARLVRKRRIRSKISGTGEVPRVAVYRSNKFIYGQLVDDKSGKTLTAYSDAGLKAPKNKTERAKLVGKALAEVAAKKKIKRVVFDRGGYAYHGRVKALAEAMREGGLIF